MTNNSDLLTRQLAEAQRVSAECWERLRSAERLLAVPLSTLDWVQDRMNVAIGRCLVRAAERRKVSLAIRTARVEARTPA